MNRRSFLLAVTLAPLVLFAGWELKRTLGQESAFPDLDPKQVQQFSLQHGANSVTVVRDQAGWMITSAADAPGDKARIEGFLRGLADMKGEEGLPEAAPAKSVRVTLKGVGGQVLGEGLFGTDRLWKVKEGAPAATPLDIGQQPALPLWASAWSTVQAPTFKADQLAQGQWLTINGPQPMNSDELVEAAQMMATLTAWDFVGGDRVNWAAARSARLSFVDGGVVDIQLAPDGEGRSYIRLTSDNIKGIRDFRRFAFRTDKFVH